MTEPLSMETQLQPFLFRLVNLCCGGEDKYSSSKSKYPLALDIEHVEKMLGYKFKNKSLLQQAFTDASFDESRGSNDRLENFGDSVLNLLVTKEIYIQYPNISSGELTKLQAVNVDTEKLDRVAVKLNLYRYLRHKKPLLEDHVLKFTKEIEEFPLHSRGLLKVPKYLADIVESTIGAVYVDSNFSIETVWRVVKPLLDPIITLDKLTDHPKTHLHEMCQKKNLKLTFKDTWEDDKTILVFIDGRLVGRGHHLLKKNIASNCAAKNTVDNFPKIFQEL